MQHHWILENVESKKSDITYIFPKEMVADKLTKAQDPKLFQAFRIIIGVHLAVTRWLSMSVESIAILYLYIGLVFSLYIIYSMSHLFRVLSFLYHYSTFELFLVISFRIYHLFHVSTIPRLNYSVSHIYHISLFFSSILYLKYSIF